MLSKVSWSVYAEVVLILLIIYYVIVGIKYYRKEIKDLLSGKFRENPATGKTPAEKHTAEVIDEPVNDGSYDELETIVNDIRYAILDKAGKQANKAEMLLQLQHRLANYSGLRKPAYRIAVNNFIITHAKDICGIDYDADELNRAWDELPL